jgi:uncharacterized protein YidB (DUF937 family)
LQGIRTGTSWPTCCVAPKTDRAPQVKAAASAACLAGGLLGGELSELVDRFKKTGQADTVDSWVSTGPNKQIAPSQLEQAIGPDVLETLSKQTGLSKQELLARLSRELPDAVDKYTPDGRLPAPA